MGKSYQADYVNPPTHTQESVEEGNAQQEPDLPDLRDDIAVNGSKSEKLPLTLSGVGTEIELSKPAGETFKTEGTTN